ncbi:MAG TPA: helix-turn-helix transcriptional regulator [Solirubrobacterales bacterium]
MKAEKDMAQNGEISFGDDLRKAREQKGLSVEAISDATKVASKHIRSLEAGQFEELPGGVFRRGFVRSYVGALGLEEGGWIKRFDEVCRACAVSGAPNSDWTRFAENVKNNRAASPPRRVARGAGFVLLLILLALAAWCGWRLKTHRRLLPSPLVALYSNSWVHKAH